MAGKTQRFRALIEAEESLVQPGINDGLSARPVQQMGFRSAAISGGGLSDTDLGRGDVGLMSYEENLHASRAIAAEGAVEKIRAAAEGRVIERPDLAVSSQELKPMGFSTIRDMEQCFLTTAQRETKCGAAR